VASAPGALAPAKVGEVAPPDARIARQVPPQSPVTRDDEATFSAAALDLAAQASAAEVEAVAEDRFAKIASIRAAIADGTYDESTKLDAVVDRILEDIL
jgi:anti-sigma28 factor (negative regulator of flagellin synthesis)